MFRGKAIALWIGVSFFSILIWFQPCNALDFTGILTHGTGMSPFAGGASLNSGTGGGTILDSLHHSQVSPWSASQSASSGGNSLPEPFEEETSPEDETLPTETGSSIFENGSYFNDLTSVTHMSICPFSRPTEPQAPGSSNTISPFGLVGVSSNYTDALGFHYNIGSIGSSGTGSGSTSSSIQQIMSYFH